MFERIYWDSNLETLVCCQDTFTTMEAWFYLTSCQGILYEAYNINKRRMCPQDTDAPASVKIELDLPIVVPNNVSKYQNIWS